MKAAVTQGNALEIGDIPIIDAHCHPFPEEKALTLQEFLGRISLRVQQGPAPSTEEERRQFFPDFVMLENMAVRLASLLGLGVEATIKAVVSERARIAEDYAAYVRLLFRDASIRGLVVDYGYPVPPIPHEEFSHQAGVPIARVFRIEPLILDLLPRTTCFEEFGRRYRDALSAALQEPDCVGLKTIIAYRTGLDIADRAPSAAAGAWQAWHLHVGIERDPRALSQDLKTPA